MSSETITIASLIHLDDILSINKRDQRDQREPSISKVINQGCSLVIINNNKVIGYLLAYKNQEEFSFTIYDIAILEKYRNIGLSNILFNIFILDFRPNYINLTTPKNMVEYWKKFGFIIEETLQPPPKPHYNSILMFNDLTKK